MALGRHALVPTKTLAPTGEEQVATEEEQVATDADIDGAQPASEVARRTWPDSARPSVARAGKSQVDEQDEQGEQTGPLDGKPPSEVPAVDQRAQPTTHEEIPHVVHPRPKRAELLTLQCQLCLGDGRLNVPGSQVRTYRCPVCVGKGEVLLRLPAGKNKCLSCQGMGRIAELDDFRRANNKYIANRCINCRGTGIARD